MDEPWKPNTVYEYYYVWYESSVANKKQRPPHNKRGWRFRTNHNATECTVVSNPNYVNSLSVGHTSQIHWSRRCFKEVSDIPARTIPWL